MKTLLLFLIIPLINLTKQRHVLSYFPFITFIVLTLIDIVSTFFFQRKRDQTHETQDNIIFLSKW